jgi:hypothetical protein
MAPWLKFMMEGLMDLQAGQWEVAASGGGVPEGHIQEGE